jgi:NAD(P)-dependent dehydrogenase (short-subunit alcohol dehydrogenase family)
MQLAGKLALVTGGGRGIGAACARALATAGATVVVTGRTQADLEAVAAEIRGTFIVCDIADRAAMDAMCTKLPGRIDILVNNAGVAESAALDRTSDELWDRILEIDATAPFRLIRALVPAMATAGWGRVVNIASNAGVSRALAVDLARTGVTINALCPGWVHTRMSEEAVARIAAKTGRSVDEARGQLESMSPQKRMIDPAEVAHAAVMLCADAARGIHGQTIVIDGGAILK